MVVFKMLDSVPSPRYSPVCNVLRQWKTSLIPTYRVSIESTDSMIDEYVQLTDHSTTLNGNGTKT